MVTTRGRSSASIGGLALLFVLLACIAPLAIAFRASPLRPSAKDDFEGMKFKVMEDPGEESWLCPYQYLPVPLDRRNPLLVAALSNLTQLFDSQFNFTKYGAFYLFSAPIYHLRSFESPKRHVFLCATLTRLFLSCVAFFG